jgi:hypothetical protein
VVARRKQRGWPTRQEFANNVALTYRVLTDVENGTRRLGPKAYAEIEKALEWQPGSVDAIIHGGEPTLVMAAKDRADLADHRLMALSAQLNRLNDRRDEAGRSGADMKSLDAEIADLRMQLDEARDASVAAAFIAHEVDHQARLRVERAVIDLVGDGQDLASKKRDPEVSTYVRQVESAVVGMFGINRVSEELHSRKSKGDRDAMETATESATSPEGDQIQEVGDDQDDAEASRPAGDHHPPADLGPESSTESAAQARRKAAATGVRNALGRKVNEKR